MQVILRDGIQHENQKYITKICQKTDSNNLDILILYYSSFLNHFQIIIFKSFERLISYIEPPYWILWSLNVLNDLIPNDDRNLRHNCGLLHLIVWFRHEVNFEAWRPAPLLRPSHVRVSVQTTNRRVCLLCMYTVATLLYILYESQLDARPRSSPYGLDRHPIDGGVQLLALLLVTHLFVT